MTRYIPPALLAIFMLASAGFAAPQTMRLDYYHTGNSKQEVFSVDRIVIEPLPWPGDLNKTVDDSNLGKYLFEVRDPKSGRMLYSRGFASIFGEWETTDEAATMTRTFSESLRFPAPGTSRDSVQQPRRAEHLAKRLVVTYRSERHLYRSLRRAGSGATGDDSEDGRPGNES